MLLPQVKNNEIDTSYMICKGMFQGLKKHFRFLLSSFNADFQF